MNTILQRWLTLVLFSMGFLITSGQPIAKNDEYRVIKNYDGAASDNAISKSDEKYIKWSAEMVMTRFMDLLNFISTSQGLEIAEVDNIIRKSFSQPDSKLFYDSTAIVEDDLHLIEKDKKAKEKIILRYLKDFDLLYKKDNKATVVFNHFSVSNIKSKDYLYVKVFYDCLFTNKSKISDQPFELQKRVAELKVEKIDNTWKTWITDIHFLDSLDISNASRNDIIIKDNQPMADNTANAWTDNKFAKVVSNDNSDNNKIKSTPQELYTYYMKEALFAESQKKYEEALNNYRLAIANNPEKNDQLNKKVRELKTRVDNIKSFEEKYTAGQYKDAINDYDNAIKKDINNTDYYFGRAKCYVKTGDYNLAMKDYDKAIKIDPTYIQAYKMKAALYEIQEAYPEAIANYEICTSLEKNNITLYHKIASLYVTLGNLTAAIDAFDKAISINNKTAFLFHLRGELLYKLNKLNEAEISFSTAIRLDSAKAVSYFFRGLCRYDLKNSEQAMSDFAKAKELNLESRYVQRIQQISADLHKANK